MTSTQETFVGFWKTSEYYCRNGNVATLPLGSIIIALTDSEIDRIHEEAAVLLEKEQFSTSSCDKAIQAIAQCLRSDPVWSHPVLRDYLCDKLLSEELNVCKRAAHYLKVLTSFVQIKKDLLTVLPETLLRHDKGDVPPIVRSAHYFEKHPDEAKKFGIGEYSFDCFSTVIRAETAGTFDEAKGWRMVTAYSTNSLWNIVNAEFRQMVAHNVSLVICNYCHRYFLPLTSASSFCDRPLDEDPTRTCKSLSSQWYVDNRRSHDPAWNEYMLYISRYKSRTYRNKAKNPKERLDRWNKQARQLFHDYDSGKITREEFSSTLAKMDKDMKPLDK